MPATLPAGVRSTGDYAIEQDKERVVGHHRSILLWSAGVLTAAAFGGMLVWLMSGEDGSSQMGNDIPVLRALEAPVKTRPEEPGGMPVPHRDKLIYRRLTGNEELPVYERVIPPPEEPLSLPGVAEPGPSADANIWVGEDEAPSAAFVPAPLEESVLAPPTEEFLDNMVPDTSPAIEAPPDSVEAPPDSSSVAMAAPRPRPTAPPSSAPSGSAPSSKSGLSAEARAAKDLLMGTAAGDYAVQLASVRSRQEANREWERLRRRHSDILGSLQLTVLEADLGQRGKYYRLRAGPITNQNSARRVCDSLVDRKVTCIVVPY